MKLKANGIIARFLDIFGEPYPNTLCDLVKEIILKTFALLLFIAILLFILSAVVLGVAGFIDIVLQAGWLFSIEDGKWGPTGTLGSLAFVGLIVDSIGFLAYLVTSVKKSYQSRNSVRPSKIGEIKDAIQNKFCPVIEWEWEEDK